MANTFKFGNGNWAVKDGYALAYNDENNNFKPLPFDFTRASSATKVNKQGLVEVVPSGKPRIDFTDNTSGHLLLEPSRTNIITNSEQFVDAPTGNTNMDLFSGTITNNNTTSPDGNTKGMKYTISSGSGAKLRIYQSDLSTSSDTTFSIYAKSGTTDSLSIAISGGTTKSVTTTNEWQRITTTDTSNTSKFIDVDVSGSVDQYIYIFGMQAEAGSYATSYIPTEGSSVTRVAPICKQDLSQVVSSNTHTIYWEGIAKSHSGNDGFAITFSESDTNINNAILLYRFSNGKIGFYGSLNQSAIFSAPLSESTASDMNTVAKYALAIENNRLSIYRNGTKIISSTATQTIPTNLKWLQLNRWNNISALNTSTYKDLRYYNTALTDTELQNLTS